MRRRGGGDGIDVLNGGVVLGIGGNVGIATPRRLLSTRTRSMHSYVVYVRLFSFIPRMETACSRKKTTNNNVRVL